MIIVFWKFHRVSVHTKSNYFTIINIVLCGAYMMVGDRKCNWVAGRRKINVRQVCSHKRRHIHNIERMELARPYTTAASVISGICACVCCVCSQPLSWRRKTPWCKQHALDNPFLNDRVAVKPFFIRSHEYIMRNCFKGSKAQIFNRQQSRRPQATSFTPAVLHRLHYTVKIYFMIYFDNKLNILMWWQFRPCHWFKMEINMDFKEWMSK